MAMEDRSMMPMGTTLGRRFEVEACLGQGGFGFVFRCHNIQTGERVAIKVNKSTPDVVRIARTEIAMLRQLRCLDPDTCNIIKWNGFFFDKEQICLNFELLDQSLRDYLEERDCRGLPMTELRPIVHQLTTAFRHLRSMGIAHADLKPDNVMIVDRQQQPLRIKLIDFGLALPSSEFQPGLNMGTVSYKAPEIMLEAPFCEAIDMWSLGITIAEVATGRPLYDGNTDYDVLNLIIKTHGHPEDELLHEGERTPLYFKSENNSQRRWKFKTREEFAEDTGYYGMESGDFGLSSLDELEQLMVWDTESQSDQHLLVDLIKRMLTLNPDNRITPQEVLQHPFFAQSVPQSSHAADLDNIEEAEDVEEVQDSEEETPEPRQQGSGYLGTGSENCREEDTSDLSQWSSPDQILSPDNVHCRFDSSPADTPSELNQQCSGHHTAGHNRVERSSADKGIETPDPQEGTPEHSDQSSSGERVERENFHCRIERPPSNTCKELPEEGTPEPSQQCSGYHKAGPANRHCGVKGPPPGFEVEACLGQGGFGFVFRCRNIQTGERVAIKVNKSTPDVVRIARTEIAMLRQLRCLDPDTCNIIKWNGFFFDKEQICLNFELLDQSLRDYLEERDCRGLPMTELRPIVHQLTTAFRHLHSMGIAHADLKPDNVMIVDRQQQPLRIKLIDFGLALPSSEFQPGLNMGTVSYKAPEIMLEAPFCEAIDMWSLGITIAEVATGRPLYDGNTDYDVLNLIIKTHGHPEDELLHEGERTPLYFKSENNSQRRWRFKTREEFAEDTGYYGMESGDFSLSSLDELEQLMVWDTESQSDQSLLVDLIKRMLTLNPDNRITPQEVLQHPFFAQSVPQSSHAADLDNIEEAEDVEEVQDSEEETPEPRQQGSGYLGTGSENCREEDTPDLSQWSSPDQILSPDNVHCRFESSPADTPSELNQQCSGHHTAGHNRVERSSADKGIETPDPQEGTPEHSDQSSSGERVERENFHCRIERPPSNTCKELPEEGTPEHSQQCSGYHKAGPANRHCGVKGPPPGFEVEACLGQGGFGFVFRCRNIQTGERVAIKVNKSTPDVVRIARTEIAMLRQLRCLDPDTCNIIKWNGFFFDKEQICLNFELLDQSLRDYLEERDCRGLPMTELRPIVHQLTTAFRHLRSMGIAHADLKPDNVMIVDRQQQPLRIKLIDFGLALPSSEFQPGLNMGTVSYKAPEIMLEAPFCEAIDMWSLGITIAEVATGRPLYDGNTDYDVLNLIIKTHGHPEDELLHEGERTPLYFKSENNSQRRWRFKTREEFAEDTGYYGMESGDFGLSSLDELEQLMVWDTESQNDQRLLVDLIKRMLTLNPDDRITPQEVLQHPFFAQSKSL